MNKKQAGVLFHWCLLASVFFLFWGNAMVQAGRLEEFRNGVSIRMTEAVGFRNVKQALQEAMNPPDSYVCWNVLPASAVSNEEKTNQTKATPYEIAGDMSLAYPAPLISGSYVTQEDRYGCMIDRKTAERIFGSQDIIGLPVRYQKSTYYVRGILESADPILLFQNIKEDTDYQNMELVFSDLENGGLLAEEFLLYCNAGGYELLEGGFYGKICAVLAQLPGQLLAAAILVKLAAAVYRRRGKAGQALSALALCLPAGVTVWILSGFVFYIPERLIPTRWSDLKFWSAQTEAFLSWLKRMESLEPAAADLLLRRWMAAAALSALLSLVAAALLVNPGWKMKAAFRMPGVRMCYLAASFLLPACVCLYYAARGERLVNLSGFLLLLPLLNAILLLRPNRVRSGLHRELCSRPEQPDPQDA